jgi:hypothetical protein
VAQSGFQSLAQRDHFLMEGAVASQVALCRLHRDVAKQELDLLQLATGFVTQLRAGSAQTISARTGASAPKEKTSRNKEIAEDWYLKLRGKLRSGEILK